MHFHCQPHPLPRSALRVPENPQTCPQDLSPTTRRHSRSTAGLATERRLLPRSRFATDPAWTPKLSLEPSHSCRARLRSGVRRGHRGVTPVLFVDGRDSQ
jgi:hypothetical protein